MSTKWVVNFPTLGDLWDAWVFAHCRIPDGYRRGENFEWSDWQFWCFANLGRIREGLKWEGEPLRSQAFHFRRAQIQCLVIIRFEANSDSFLFCHYVIPPIVRFTERTAPREFPRKTGNIPFHSFLRGHKKGIRIPVPRT